MTDSEAHIALNKYRERFSEIGIFENSLLEGAKEILEELRNSGKRIALATSKPYVYAEKILEKYDIAKYFDCAVGSELDGTRNYKDEVILEVLKRTGEDDLSRVVMVGDRKHDIIGAEKCKIASIGLRCGYAEEGELEDAGADYIFENLHDLKEFLMK